LICSKLIRRESWSLVATLVSALHFANNSLVRITALFTWVQEARRRDRLLLRRLLRLTLHKKIAFASSL